MTTNIKQGFMPQLAPILGYQILLFTSLTLLSMLISTHFYSFNPPKKLASKK
uniref:ATP synthase F0 subunit 8 n=1 Tax=Melampus sincaporensis TaxID=1628046 RepID=UPI0030010F5A|nr:ATP synthase F0 subunit 8 [Melampus sincaporensis]